MRFWLAAAFAALLAAPISAHADVTDKAACVTEKQVVVSATAEGGQLAGRLTGSVAEAFLAFLPPLPGDWKPEDFRLIHVWGFHSGSALIVLFNKGCSTLQAIVPLDEALTLLGKVQRDA